MKMRVLLLVIAAAALLVGCGSTSDQSSKIATKIGASSCTASSYEITSRLDNSKSRIYDCDLNGKMICVTERGGIASDQTETVKLLFANTLGADSKPDCAS